MNQIRKAKRLKVATPALIGVWVGTKYTYDYYESYSFAEDGTFTIRHDFAGNPSSPEQFKRLQKLHIQELMLPKMALLRQYL